MTMSGCSTGLTTIPTKSFLSRVTSRFLSSAQYEYGVYVADQYQDFWLQNIADELEDYGARHGMNETEIVNLAISFVQQLEYTTDEVNNGYSNYPQYPVETLKLRSGDCEDTSILLSGILDRLGYGTVLLAMPDDAHMAVGVLGDSSLPGSY